MNERSPRPRCLPIDWRDIGATLDGDEDAYQQLVTRYQPGIGRYLWRYARNRTDWELLVQDVFVEAYFSLSRFRGSGPFEAWLRRIATRLGYRYWRQHARSSSQQSLEQADADAFVHPDSGSPAEDAEAADLLHRLLNQLGPRDRLVLTLQYFEDLNTRQIARHTGWSRTMVKVQTHRARRRLQAMLEAKGTQS